MERDCDDLYVLSKLIVSRRADSTEELPNEIFDKLPREFEKQFFEDMQALGVKPPSVITRVSSTSDISKYVEKLFENGFDTPERICVL